MPLSSKKSWTSSSELDASSTRPGTSWRTTSPGRRRARQQEGDERDRREEHGVDGDDGERARQPGALHERDERVEDQRDDGRDDEQQQDDARGVRERVEREHAERQHDELHPARDDHRRGRRRRLRVGGRGLLSHPASEYAACPMLPRPSCSSETSSDRWASTRCWAFCPRCASAMLRRSSSSTARTPRAGSASRRRSPTSCSRAGVDVITLGNHAYHRREIFPYLDAHDGDPAAVQLPAQPAGPRRLRRRARRRAPRRREPQRQPLRARRLSGVHVDRAGAGRAEGPRRPRARRLPRRGDEREGRAWAGTSTAA